MPLRPVCQPGLATTPKLTGGHGVARGPDRVDGFALRPAWTSQLVFGWVIVRNAVAAVGRPVVSRDACCAWWMVSMSVRGVVWVERGLMGETNSLERRLMMNEDEEKSANPGFKFQYL
jgi:hypothetical protein